MSPGTCGGRRGWPRGARRGGPPTPRPRAAARARRAPAAALGAVRRGPAGAAHLPRVLVPEGAHLRPRARGAAAGAGGGIHAAGVGERRPTRGGGGLRRRGRGVAAPRRVAVSGGPPEVSAAFRAGLDAHWTFLSDVERRWLPQLGLQESTEPGHQPYPPTGRPLPPGPGV